MPKKVRKKSAFTNKSAKKSAFTNKSAQKSTLKSTFGSSEPIWPVDLQFPFGAFGQFKEQVERVVEKWR